jgi:hypothetical protein
MGKIYLTCMGRCAKLYEIKYVVDAMHLLSKLAGKQERGGLAY